MVDVYGKWHEEKDYTTYPKEKWCDYDYVANWIRSTDYEIKTTMENLATMIFLYYDMALESDEENKGYYSAPYESCTEDYAPNMADIICYVEENGGLKEFDFECQEE